MAPSTSSQSSAKHKTASPRGFFYKAFAALSPWFSEFMACLGSCALVIIIVSVLSPFNNKPVDKWKWLITLNAVLSVLVTILYLLMMVPISKCISQLKWNHYARRQPFRDIDVFDQASRSPFGSLRFLLTDMASAMLPRTYRNDSFDLAHRLLAWLAAFLTLSVTAIGPFVQQVLTQHSVPLDSGNASVPTFNATSSSGQYGALHGQNGAPAELASEATFTGLYAYDVQAFDVQSTCINANCTWEPFWTLVVHSECNDLTDQLREVKLNISLEQEGVLGEEVRYQLSNGFYVSNVLHNVRIESTYNLTASFPSITYSDRGQVLANFFFLTGGFRNDEDDYPTPVSTSAVECIYQLAGRQVQAQYINGVYSEAQIGPLVFNNTRDGRKSSPWRVRMASRPIKPGAVDSSGEEHGQPVDMFNDGTLFYMDPAWPDVTWYFGNPDVGIQDPDRGAWLEFMGAALISITDSLMETLQMVDMANYTDNTWGRASYGAAEAFYRLFDDPEIASVTLQERIDNVARSLTRGLRTSVWSSQVTVSTIAYRNGLLYKVSWGWIALPASLVVLSFLLLALTIRDTRCKGLQKWTDNSFALIARGGDSELRQALLHAGDLRAMEDFAKKQSVNLGPAEVLTAQRL